MIDVNAVAFAEIADAHGLLDCFNGIHGITTFGLVATAAERVLDKIFSVLHIDSAAVQPIA